jgi:hypothetical protein
MIRRALFEIHLFAVVLLVSILMRFVIGPAVRRSTKSL